MNRRRFLGSFTATIGAAFPLAGCVTVAPETPRVFGGLAVDVTPLRRQGLGLFAERVEATMTQAAIRIFATRLDRADRDAPLLVLQIDSVTFTDGASERKRGAGESTDTMVGVALIVSHGTAVQRVPMMGAYTSRWHEVLNPMGDQQRLAALCDFWAGWMLTELGGAQPADEADRASAQGR